MRSMTFEGFSGHLTGESLRKEQVKMVYTNGDLVGTKRLVGPRPAAAYVPIIGLNLGGCGAEQVERALRSSPGVLYAYVNRSTETAYVRYDAERSSPAALRRGIEAFGLRAGSAKTWR